MLLATAEANNLAAKAVSKEFYIRAMEQVFLINFSMFIYCMLSD